MIIFYNKQTGIIKGTIEGRIHGKDHFDMWIGEKDENDRIVIPWIKKEGGSFEPNTEDEDQKKIFVDIDKDPISIYNFTIDLNSKKLVRKGQI